MYRFSLEHITAFLFLGRLAKYSALLLRAVLNSKMASKEHIMVKNVALNTPQKKTLVYSNRAETRGRKITLFHISWKCAPGTIQKGKMKSRLPWGELIGHNKVRRAGALAVTVLAGVNNLAKYPVGTNLLCLILFFHFMSLCQSHLLGAFCFLFFYSIRFSI